MKDLYSFKHLSTCISTWKGIECGSTTSPPTILSLDSCRILPPKTGAALARSKRVNSSRAMLQNYHTGSFDILTGCPMCFMTMWKPACCLNIKDYRVLNIKIQRVEQPKSKILQPKFQSRWDNLYLQIRITLQITWPSRQVLLIIFCHIIDTIT